MRATWINLYGIHPKDRGWFLSNNLSKKEGATFLGRVLIQMQLSPNEKPQLTTTMANPIKEPATSNFLLWVDVYDLVGCEEAGGKPLYIQATIGTNTTGKWYAKYKDGSKSYTWQKISIKQLQVNYPQDLSQTPDIIINVYIEKTFTGDHRIGYIRIPAQECQRKTANP